jgi:hypothetical protein
MRNDRITQASERIVDAVESEARERGIDETAASNLAVDVSLQDDVLRDLCPLLDDLERATRQIERDDSIGREIEDSTLSAGIDLDDAIRARCETLIEEILDEAERQELERATNTEVEA